MRIAQTMVWSALGLITRVKRKIQIEMVVGGSRREKFIVPKSTGDSHFVHIVQHAHLKQILFDDKKCCNKR